MTTPKHFFFLFESATKWVVDFIVDSHFFVNFLHEEHQSTNLHQSPIIILTPFGNYHQAITKEGIQTIKQRTNREEINHKKVPPKKNKKIRKKKKEPLGSTDKSLDNPTRRTEAI